MRHEFGASHTEQAQLFNLAPIFTPWNMVPPLIRERACPSELCILRPAVGSLRPGGGEPSGARSSGRRRPGTRSPDAPRCRQAARTATPRRFAERFGVERRIIPTSNGARERRFWPERLEQPLRWRRPRMIFVNSMSDLFHEHVPLDFVERRLRGDGEASGTRSRSSRSGTSGSSSSRRALPWPANVWMGVSIENSRWIERADELREVPAAVRFISAEPLLGPLDGLDLDRDRLADRRRRVRAALPAGARGVDARAARPLPSMQGVAFFFKQWGGRTLEGRRPRARRKDPLATAAAYPTHFACGACLSGSAE